MGKRILTTDEQIEKLNLLDQIAKSAAKSPDLDRRLGAFVIHAGMVDFLAVQFARLIEQIILKGQISEGKEPTFKPRGDDFFYDNRISTRKILKEGERLFGQLTAPDAGEEEKIKKSAQEFVETATAFLNYRNPLIHHIGSPEKSFENIKELCSKADAAFVKFIEAQKIFFDTAAPYRFGEEEMRRFYGA